MASKNVHTAAIKQEEKGGTNCCDKKNELSLVFKEEMKEEY